MILASGIAVKPYGTMQHSWLSLNQIMLISTLHLEEQYLVTGGFAIRKHALNPSLLCLPPPHRLLKLLFYL